MGKSKKKIKEKVDAWLLNEKTPFVLLCICLVLVLIFIVISAAYTLVLKDNPLSISEWVEYSFLCACLLYLVVVYKRYDKHLIEAIMGELLAVFFVSYTIYFVEVANNAIHTKSIVDYLYMVVELIFTIQCLILFIAHILMEREKKAKKMLSMALDAILFGAVLLIAYDLFLLTRYSEHADLVNIVSELLDVFFAICLTSSIRSFERIREKKKKEKETIFV